MMNLLKKLQLALLLGAVVLAASAFQPAESQAQPTCSEPCPSPCELTTCGGGQRICDVLLGPNGPHYCRWDLECI